MLSNLIPSQIKTYTSNKFISLGYKLIFKSLLTNIKKGKLIVEIDDDNYPEYKTNGKPMVYGNSISGYEYEDNTTANLKIINLYNFLNKVVFGHDIGIGESYVMGDFKCDNLKSLIKIESSRNAIKTHYNISNQFYEIMLGKSMCYSSGLYKSKDEPLYDAQIRKLHSLIDKAQVTKDDHILEIGCGWGSLLIEAVKRTGCKATGISLSEEQVKYARELVKKEGLDHLIDIQVCHYKDIKGQYSKIISNEMMEHVGYENYGLFFNTVDRVLAPNGIFVFQVITYRDKDFEKNRMANKVGFINKYIFLGGELPSITAMVKAATEHSTLELQDAESIGQHYSISLDQWNQNLLNNQDKIKQQFGFDQQFINMFEYYLNYCSAGFETKYINDLQFIYSRPLNTKNLNINYYK